MPSQWLLETLMQLGLNVFRAWRISLDWLLSLNPLFLGGQVALCRLIVGTEWKFIGMEFLGIRTLATKCINFLYGLMEHFRTLDQYCALSAR